MTEAAVRYSRTAMILHWVIALMLAFELALGGRTEHAKPGAELFWVFQLHKSVGITILFLSLWRLGMRLFRPRPIALADKGWAGRLSTIVHWLFYLVMIGSPLTGWILVSTAKVKIPTLLYGLIPWPHLPVSGQLLHEAAENIHGAFAALALALFALHILGAIRHQLLLKEALIERMVPLRKVGAGAIVGLVGAVVLVFAAGKLVHPKAVALPASAPVIADVPVPVTAPPAEAVAKAVEETPAETIFPSWKVNAGGRVGFTVTVSGQKVVGQFNRWTADIKFDPKQLEASSINASIDLGSVASGDGDRDGMLAGSDFFNTVAHPRATFTSTAIKSLGGNRYEARGTLSMKGVSRPLRLPFTLDINGDNAKASGSAGFDRRDYKVGEGQFEGTDEVGGAIAVSLNFSARKKP